MFMLNILKPQMAVNNFIKVSDYVVVCPLLFTIASYLVLTLDVVLSVLRIFDTSVITFIIEIYIIMLFPISYQSTQRY